MPQPQAVTQCPAQCSHLQRFPHAQAQPAADKAGVVVVLRRAHARLAPLAERAGRGRARGHAPGHAPSGVRQPQQPDQGASLLAARRRGEAARDAAPGSRGRPTRELRAEQRAGASGARAVHTVRQIRAAALRCSHGPRPRRRGVVHGPPSGLSELRRARLGLQAKPLPGRSGHAARTPHRRRSYSSCMSSSARRLRRKGHGGATFMRRRSAKRSSALSVLQGRKKKSS